MITLNGTTGITNDGGYTGDGVVFADTTPANTLVTTSGGNVGIGTSSPSGAKVQIVGDNSALRVGDGTRDMYVDPDSGGIFLSNGAGQTGEGFYLASSGNTLRMYTSSTERARIDTSGNLLVGTTSSIFAGGKVQVQASGFAVNVSQTDAGGGGAAFGANRTASDGWVAGFYRGGTGAGSISLAGASTAYNTSSDYRLKENVQPLTGALQRVSQLRPVIWEWKQKFEGSSQTGEGFIAHEVQEICPAAVSGEKDAVDAEGKPVYQGIDTSFLVATLTAAIQEQQALITALTARVAALEGTAA